MTGHLEDASALSLTDEVVLKKLKPGPRLSRAAVAIDQKTRVQAALSRLASESGFDGITVRALVRDAGVSTSTFYRHYQSLEDCLAGIVGATIGGIVVDIEPGESDSEILDGLRNRLLLLMQRLAQEPEVVYTVFVEAPAAGPGVLGELNSALGDFGAALARTFAAAPRPAAGTTRLGAGLAAGVVGVIRRTALTGRSADLPDVADDLTDWMLSVAREEVLRFCGSRSPSENDVFAGQPARVDSSPASREALTDAGHRAVITAARLASRTGFAGLSSARIRKDAGLSRAEFDRHFSGVEDCFLEAIESVVNTALRTARTFAATSGSWEQWIYKVLGALCSLAARDRDLARFVLLDVMAAGRTGLMRREDMIARAAVQVCAAASPDRRPSELAAIASISAIWRIAETETAARRTNQLPRVAPAFAYIIFAARIRNGAASYAFDQDGPRADILAASLAGIAG